MCNIISLLRDESVRIPQHVALQQKGDQARLMLASPCPPAQQGPGLKHFDDCEQPSDLIKLRSTALNHQLCVGQ